MKKSSKYFGVNLMMKKSSEGLSVTEQARVEALERPDPWEVADHFMELGLALAGIVGGVYGSRVARTLQTARQKSQALKEVVQGNQLFKKDNPKAAESIVKAPPPSKIVS